MSRFSGRTVLSTARHPIQAGIAPADESLRAEVSTEFENFASQGSQNLQEISARLQRLIRLTGVAIAVEQGGDVVCVASSGPSAPPVGTFLDRSRGLSAECLRTGESKVSNDAWSDPRVNREACRKNGIRSTVVVPLLVNGEAVGILGVFSDTPGYFADRQVFLLEFIAAFLSRLSAIAPAAAETPVAEEVPLLMEQSSVATSAAELESSVPIALPLEEPRGKLVMLVAAGILLAVAALYFVLIQGGSGGTVATVDDAHSVEAESKSGTHQPALPVLGVGSTIASSLEHWSAPGYTRITIRMDRERSFRCERLMNPARLYCDFRNLSIPLEYAGQEFEDDPLVGGVRAGQYRPEVARLVFDLKNPSSRHAVAVLSNPARLIVEVMDLSSMGVGTSRGSPDVKSGAQGEDSSTFPEDLTIVIDPGHGGRDTGTIGPAGLKEKDLVLDVARRLGKMLESQLGARVVLTRSMDRFLSLEARSEAANKAGAGLFLSIHGNGSDYAPAEGVETYYLGESDSPRAARVAEKENNASRKDDLAPVLKLAEHSEAMDRTAESRALALDVQAALYKAAAETGGSRNRGVRAAPFVVLRDAKMPAILAEISFLSSEAEERRLMQAKHRQMLADGLFRGIATHLARRKGAAEKSMALR